MKKKHRGSLKHKLQGLNPCPENNISHYNIRKSIKILLKLQIQLYKHSIIIHGKYTTPYWYHNKTYIHVVIDYFYKLSSYTYICLYFYI